MCVNENKKVVITGGPGCGKSTLINLLARSGYNCLKEFSRTLIQKYKNKGEENYFKSKPIQFSKLIWKKEKNNLSKQMKWSLNKINHLFFLTGEYTM